MNHLASAKLLKARISLLMDQPFFGQLLLELEPVERTDLPTKTMATDGVHLFYDPDFVIKTPENELTFICAHEVIHPMFDHLARGEGKDPEAWNIAIDYADNSLLVDSGMNMPPYGLYDVKYKGMHAEEIYASFSRGKNGKPRPGQDQGRVLDDHLPQQGKTKEQRQDETDRWKRRVVSAAQQANQRGKLPGCLKTLVKELTADDMDWRARLRRFATQFFPIERNWNRFNRRWLSQSVYLPGLDGRKMSTFVVVTDDSGSVVHAISEFGAEARAARAAANPQRTFILSCDAAVNWSKELDALDEFELQSHGGGGTDFRPPFAWLDERGIVPDCLIYLTDGYGSFPVEPAPFPVLWCITTEVVAPWGETVRVDIAKG